MGGSPTHPKCSVEENIGNEAAAEEENEENKRNQLCDFCGEFRALLYCRADSAKLCFSCDREVHSANPLFSKHTRSQLCNSCNSNAASIHCSSHNLVLCQNCDCDSHGRSSLSSLHDRRPLEGFSGCPSAIELHSIFGFEDAGDESFLTDETAGEFSDVSVWETPTIFSLDDLITSMDSTHNFQAMGILPLPKNRNVACGRHKEEILRQLQNLVKLEPILSNDDGEAVSFLEFQTHLREQDFLAIDFEYEADPFVLPNYQETTLHWHSDSGEEEDQVSFPFSSTRNSNDEGSHGEKHEYLTISESLPVLPRVAQHELASQNRDSLISRYKEKKKTRRYDKHVRYESRKARADSRTRFKGRFAKVDH